MEKLGTPSLSALQSLKPYTLVSAVDPYAESCCLALDSSWKCPVEGCPGSDFLVKARPSRGVIAAAGLAVVACFQPRWSYGLGCQCDAIPPRDGTADQN